MTSAFLAWVTRKGVSVVMAAVVGAAVTACGSSAVPQSGPGGAPAPGVCGDHAAYRNAYFGDLHVHTSYSFDAYLFGNHMNDPGVAYDFAKGQRIRLNDNARGERFVQLRQPLDFAAVTDHAEYIGEVRMCTDPEQGPLAYYDPLCLQFRTALPSDSIGFLVWGLRLTRPTYGRHHFCIYGDCTTAAQSVWEQSTRITNSHNEPCRFTAFNGYEYSPSSDGSRMHRNIIFRSEQVPEAPVSYFDAPEPIELFHKLNDVCLTEDGCEYLSIPHNANLSHGRLLWADPERFSDPQYVADLREISRLNPVLEMMQIKGSSECKLGLGGSTDEECEFEQVRSKPLCCDAANGVTENCVAPLPGLPFFGEPNCHEVCPDDRPKPFQNEPDNSQGCIASHDFMRGAFLKGMAAQKVLGFNPNRYALIAATDNHNAASGDVEEAGGVEAPLGWEGAHGVQDDDVEERFDVLTNIGRITNPGGLAGIWAEENTRESLYAALQRGEVFATSGPRIRLRLFAGDYPQGMCSQPSETMKRSAYEMGTAMGGDVPAGTDPGGPRFVVQALADQHPLQRTQIVKLWVDVDGKGHERIFELGRYAEPAAVSDTCEVQFAAAAETRMAVCHEWQDPAFDAEEHASYYARVFEDRSCRWTGHLCAALQASNEVQCETEPDHPCCTTGPEAVIKVLQERAWSSPVWYTPEVSP